MSVDIETTERIARRFVALLLANLGTEAMGSIAARNAVESCPDVCHTHDFADANVYMAEAFVDCGLLAYFEAINDALWNAAWARAKVLIAEGY